MQKENSGKQKKEKGIAGFGINAVVIIIAMLFLIFIYAAHYVQLAQFIHTINVNIKYDDSGSGLASFLASKTSGVSNMEALGRFQQDGSNPFEASIKSGLELMEKDYFMDISLSGTAIKSFSRGKPSSEAMTVTAQIPLPGDSGKRAEVKFRL